MSQSGILPDNSFSMNRRGFVGMATAAAAGLVAGKPQQPASQGIQSDGWRTFEVQTRVEVLRHSGRTRVWLPAALRSVWTAELMDLESSSPSSRPE